MLYFDGHDMTRMDEEDRRRLLEDLVPEEADGPIRLSQEIEGDGAANFRTACGHGARGRLTETSDTRPIRVCARTPTSTKSTCRPDRGTSVLTHC
ncbi:hypothetical protein GB927_033655 [Shinella sp. CPCC 100929]|uniref:Uncharacterized protein n=1 Tax=Shinella lacus TaxID=2654216 RepID=A0ABT1RIJ0_9HYPH|nr:hypothetical protein [Shinella lacus]